MIHKYNTTTRMNVTINSSISSCLLRSQQIVVDAMLYCLCNRVIYKVFAFWKKNCRIKKKYIKKKKKKKQPLAETIWLRIAALFLWNHWLWCFKLFRIHYTLCEWNVVLLLDSSTILVWCSLLGRQLARWSWYFWFSNHSIMHGK